MKSAKLSEEEIIEIIYYAVKENNMDIKSISKDVLKLIIQEYIELCCVFQRNYVIGELDTFKRASCLLVAINKHRLCSDKRLNASIALDAAYKMCEKPYWNVGDNYDIPEKMEEVDFKKVFEDDMYVFNKSKEMLISSLLYENGVPFNYNMNLELLYQIAIEKKHNSGSKSIEENDEKLEESKTLSNQTKKSKKQKTRFKQYLKRVMHI